MTGQDEAIDIAALLADLQSGRGQKVAAARPTWEEVGRPTYLLAGLLDELLRAHADEYSPPRLIPPTPESPAFEDAAALAASALSPSNELLISMANQFVGGLLEHLEGLSLLMVATSPMRPALALARVLLDASVHAAYVLEPGITPRDRSSRAANIRLKMLREEIADLDSDVDRDQLTELEKERRRILVAGAQDGLVRAVSKKGASQNHFEPPLPSPGMLTQSALGDEDDQSWRHLSSVVHVQERSLLQFTLGIDEIRQDVQGRSYGLLHMLPAMLTAVEALKRTAEYLGVDEDVEKASTSVLTTWSGGAGLLDDQIEVPE